MIYREYEALKRRYRETLERFDELLTEREELFWNTQPKGIRYDKDKVQNGEHPDVFAEYSAACGRIDGQLRELDGILDDRKRLLAEKEKELRASADIEDRVYCMRILDRVKVYKIAAACHYSEMQVYRILGEIKRVMESKDVR